MLISQIYKILIPKFSKEDLNEDIPEDVFLNFISDNFSEQSDKFTKMLLNKTQIQPTDIEKEYISQYTICIHASRKCNLKCKYCFGEEEYLPSCDISLETAKEAIDFFVFNYGANGSIYTVDLSGSGEPLLRFDFIKELDKHCEKLSNNTGKQVYISFATNATLVTDEIANYLHNSRYIIYGISIDGNEKQNLNRLYKNENPVYDDLIKGIEKLNNGHMGLAVTITHKNEEVDEIYSHLYSLGVDAISMHIIRDFTDSDTSLYKIDVNNLVLHYRKLVDLLLENIKAGNYDYIMPLIRGDDYFGVFIKKAMLKNNIPKHRCGAGRSRFAVDEKGDLYACSVLNGNSAFYIGDIYNGINKEKQSKCQKSNIEMNNKCKNCWCRNICAGECVANSYLKNNTFYEPDNFLCNIKKQIVTLAITFLEYLHINHKEAYLLIKNFILSSAMFSRSDSAIWSVMNFLQCKQINVNYANVMNTFSDMKRKESSPIQRGTHPQYIERYLSEYDKNICAMCIDDLESVRQIKCFPAIAYLNKKDNLYYRYFFIEKIEDDLLYFRAMESKDVIPVNTQMFLDTCSNIFIGNFGQAIE